MSKSDRLQRVEIAVLKILYRAKAIHAGASITLKSKIRSFVPPLWQRGLVEVWQQLVPGEGVRPPRYALSQSGLRLIQSILSAREEMPRKTIL